MKKFTVILVLFLSSLFSEMMPVKTDLKYLSYNLNISDYKEMDIDVLYDPQDSTLSILFYNFSSINKSTLITLTESQLTELNNAIDKWKEWNIKASQNNIELEKTITEITPKYMFFDFSDNIYLASKPSVKLEFRSLTTQKHYLKIHYKAESVENEFIDIDFVGFLSWDNVKKLEEALTPERLKSYNEITLNKKSIEDQFK